MVEIYNETIHDLLTSGTHVLEIHAHGNRINLPGIKLMEVDSFEDIENIFEVGAENRKTASTKMNSERYSGSSVYGHLTRKVTSSPSLSLK